MVTSKQKQTKEEPKTDSTIDEKEVINAIIVPLEVIKKSLDKVRAYFLKKMKRESTPKPLMLKEDERKRVIPPLFEGMSLPSQS